ncbi:hypothetical protein CAL29_27190 [Bordetella genomosp. 10]|uniref:HTH lysR-type domain-containing protein n=1 Tax=Bordetella genomosp. 10 TaxID=1416804 RepID=A0A261S3K7_9BORD|nr:nitrogen assimilation transcriptional regulator NAC [Bordetella genomosp. 10]OZI31577.1 hypothetical protein CAL29_27190 [Bordetella genomosp. 10]
MNLRRLRYFVKCVDLGSLNQAAEVLHVAQPALSQQLSILEGELKQPLLIRSKKGVVPTEAGKVLYRHAQTILRQSRLAYEDVQNSGAHLTGSVTIGMAQFSMATRLAVPLIGRVRARHPGILLYVNENSSIPMSEMILSGRADLALIGTSLYGAKPPHGLSFLPLIDEPLYLVADRTEHACAASDIAALADVGLALPAENHFLRRLVDDSFSRQGLKPCVVTEVTSMATLAELVRLHFAASILPESVARDVAQGHERLDIFPIAEPVGRARLALCQSELQPLTRAAEFVKTTLIELAQG